MSDKCPKCGAILSSELLEMDDCVADRYIVAPHDCIGNLVRQRDEAQAARVDLIRFAREYAEPLMVTVRQMDESKYTVKEMKEAALSAVCELVAQLADQAPDAGRAFLDRLSAAENDVLSAKLCGVSPMNELREANVQLAAVTAERDRIRELVGKVPKTKDGAPIIDRDMDLYHPDERGPNSHVSDDGLHAGWCNSPGRHPVTECYSTKAAAQAAKGKHDPAEDGV